MPDIPIWIVSLSKMMAKDENYLHFRDFDVILLLFMNRANNLSAQKNELDFYSDMVFHVKKSLWIKTYILEFKDIYSKSNFIDKKNKKKHESSSTPVKPDKSKRASYTVL